MARRSVARESNRRRVFRRARPFSRDGVGARRRRARRPPRRPLASARRSCARRRADAHAPLVLSGPRTTGGSSACASAASGEAQVARKVFPKRFFQSRRRAGFARLRKRSVSGRDASPPRGTKPIAAAASRARRSVPRAPGRPGAADARGATATPRPCAAPPEPPPPHRRSRDRPALGLSGTARSSPRRRHLVPSGGGQRASSETSAAWPSASAAAPLDERGRAVAAPRGEPRAGFVVAVVAVVAEKGAPVVARRRRRAPARARASAEAWAALGPGKAPLREQRAARRASRRGGARRSGPASRRPIGVREVRRKTRSPPRPPRLCTRSSQAPRRRRARGGVPRGGGSRRPARGTGQARRRGRSAPPARRALHPREQEAHRRGARALRDRERARAARRWRTEARASGTASPRGRSERARGAERSSPVGVGRASGRPRARPQLHAAAAPGCARAPGRAGARASTRRFPKVELGRPAHGAATTGDAAHEPAATCACAPRRGCIRRDAGTEGVRRAWASARCRSPPKTARGERGDELADHRVGVHGAREDERGRRARAASTAAPRLADEASARDARGHVRAPDEDPDHARTATRRVPKAAPRVCRHARGARLPRPLSAPPLTMRARAGRAGAAVVRRRGSASVRPICRLLVVSRTSARRCRGSGGVARPRRVRRHERDCGSACSLAPERVRHARGHRRGHGVRQALALTRVLARPGRAHARRAQSGVNPCVRLIDVFARARTSHTVLRGAVGPRRPRGSSPSAGRSGPRPGRRRRSCTTCRCPGARRRWKRGSRSGAGGCGVGHVSTSGSDA